MIKNSHKFLALLLCLTMVLGFSACSGGNNDTKPSDDSSGANGTIASGAMGRYVEQEEYLPEEVLAVVSMAQLPDGSLRLLGDQGGQGVGPYGVYSSSDGARAGSLSRIPGWISSMDAPSTQRP